MHPIHYSLILNLAVLAIAGLVSWKTAEPVWLILAILLLNHTIGRFADDHDPRRDEIGRDPNDDDDDDPKIGFGAKID
jgi:hypothetical protein